MVDEEYGAVLPEGIEVDEAAAYFGSTDSSDILEELSALPLEEALTIFFFDRLSDLLLKPGEFDFETAGARLGCEGGEIYLICRTLGSDEPARGSSRSHRWGARVHIRCAGHFEAPPLTDPIIC